MANEPQRQGKDPNEIGALWTKQTKHGHDYYSGTINGVRVVVFKNTKKQSEKSPDWRVLKSEPQQQQVSAPAPRQSQQSARSDEPDTWRAETEPPW